TTSRRRVATRQTLPLRPSPQASSESCVLPFERHRYVETVSCGPGEVQRNRDRRLRPWVSSISTRQRRRGHIRTYLSWRVPWPSAPHFWPSACRSASRGRAQDPGRRLQAFELAELGVFVLDVDGHVRVDALQSLQEP